MTDATLSVSELLDRVESAITATMPGPIWVRGEISGFRRTSGGAAFFKLVDPQSSEHSLDVGARGRVIGDIDLELNNAGVGSLRSGIEIRAMGTVGLDKGRGLVRLSLLKVDPTFTAGRLAIDRAGVIRRLTVDGSLARNGSLPMPIVPLRIGLVTSRGTAAHADFLDQLRRPGYRFRVATVQTLVQGDQAPDALVRGLARIAAAQVDIAVMIRGGGSKLDLAAFDTEEVGRAVAGMPVPVVTGIGHETDRSVADEAAAVAEKTPTAAAEWLVGRVADFAGRVERASEFIRAGAIEATSRSNVRLNEMAARVGAGRTSLAREIDRLDTLSLSLIEKARSGIRREELKLEAWSERFSALGVEETLKRGFALVTREDGTVVSRSGGLSVGERVRVRFADGTVDMTVEDSE